MTTQVFLSVIASVTSQILCQLTAKMTCGLKPLQTQKSELVECYKFECIDDRVA